MTKKEVKVLSPAKINLFLEVLHKRDDGYHEIETILQAVGLYDEVTLRDKEAGISIICSKEGVPEGKGNLAYRAAEIMLKETRLEKGVEIEIKKEIPVAAGMGGGSSNAAAVLIGLKRLWNLRSLKEDRLYHLAERLGMDVPFFIKGGRALGEGRGEKLTSLQKWESFWTTIVIPDLKVSTVWVYKNLNLDLTRNMKRIKIDTSDCLKREAARDRSPAKNLGLGLTKKMKQSIINMYSPKTWAGESQGIIIYNRLEEVTEKAYPQVKKIKNMLENTGGIALMSGSGPSVFGIFQKKNQAERAKEAIKKELKCCSEKVYIAKTLSGGVCIV